MHLRYHDDNKYVLLFFKAIIMQQRKKYGYGYKFKEKRMLRQKLILPVNATGEPDYEYMEQYAKNMMLKKISAIPGISGRATLSNRKSVGLQARTG